MNYEKTRELLKENMVQRNYALDTQKKFAISLNAICKYSGKYHDTSLLNHTDAKNFLENLQASNKCGNSTINNYRAAFKFIFEVTCIFRPHPDTDSGNIRTAFRNYPDTITAHPDTLSS